jgi:hypothetical protein
MACDAMVQYHAKHVQYHAKHVQYHAKHVQYHAKHVQYHAKHVGQLLGSATGGPRGTQRGQIRHPTVPFDSPSIQQRP